MNKIIDDDKKIIAGVRKLIADDKLIAVIIIILQIILLFALLAILCLHDLFDLNAKDFTQRRILLYDNYRPLLYICGTLFICPLVSFFLKWKAPLWIKTNDFFKSLLQPCWIILLIIIIGVLVRKIIPLSQLYSNEESLLSYIFDSLFMGTLASFLLIRLESVPISWKAPLWIKINDFFKSLLPSFLIILLFIFNSVLLVKIIPLSESLAIPIGFVGAVASIFAIIYSYRCAIKFEKKFDFRVKSLTHDECFSKLADLLEKDVPGLGLPPEKRISIANRNSLIPAFWVDPLEYRGIEWRAFIVAIHKKMQDQNNKTIKLDLHLPCPLYTDADEYFEVMENLANLSAKNIFSHVKDGSIVEPTQNSKHLITLGNLPTCYNTPLKLLRTNTADKYNPGSKPYYTAASWTSLSKIKKPCFSCEYEEYCFNKENLKHSLLIIYCNYVVELFENINEYSDRIFIQNNSVDKGIHFPLLIFFDQKKWSQERTKVLMTVMHEGVIETGEFTSQLLFPWDMVKGLRETIFHTKDSSKKDNRNVTQKLDDIIKTHKNKRKKLDDKLLEAKNAFKEKHNIS